MAVASTLSIEGKYQKEVLTNAMEKQTTTGNQASRIVRGNLEEWVRRKVQEFIQSILEEEIAELLAHFAGPG